MPDPFDLQLTIRPASGGDFEAELEMRLGSDVAFSAGPEPVALSVKDLRKLADQPDAYGLALTQALFGGSELREALNQARGVATGAGAALRLRLNIAKKAAALHNLRWELLRDDPDPEKCRPLGTCTDPDIYVSRYLVSRYLAGNAAPPPRPQRTLRALVAAANPSDLGALKLAPVVVEDEFDRARRGLKDVSVEFLPVYSAEGVLGSEKCTLDLLKQRLAATGGAPFDVVYLACHGVYRNRETLLLLEEEDGTAALVAGRELAEALSGVDPRPRLVILAACESADSETAEALTALGPRLIEAGVPAVVAMQGKVTMGTVERFMPVFFEKLVEHGQIDRAMAAARAAVQHRPDWWMPVLYMNLLSGQLWTEAPAAEVVRPQIAVPHEIPAPPSNFIGREEELKKLVAAIDGGRRAVNIYGTDGMGKTALALQLAHQLAGRYPDGDVYVVMTGGSDQAELTPLQALVHVIRSFDRAMQLTEDLQQVFGTYQTLMHGKQVILLLDNVRDADQVAPFLPAPEGCLVILTSVRVLEDPLDLMEPLALTRLPPAAAEQLLLDRAPRVKTFAAELARATDYLPQALQAVARLLERYPSVSPREILDLLNDASTRAETGVDAALEVSYNVLEERLKPAWRALAVFGGDFDNQAAAWVMGRLNAASSPEEIKKQSFRADIDLSEMVGYGLVEYDETRDRFQLLPLARGYAEKLLNEAAHPGEREAARRGHAWYYMRVLEQANDLLVQGDQGIQEGLALFDRELREIRLGWAWANEDPEDKDRVPLRARYPAAFVDLIALRLAPSERIAWLQSGREAARAVGNRRLEAVLLSGLGVAYYILGQYKQAQDCQEQSLRLARAADYCPAQLSALGNLGKIFYARKNFERARRYFQEQLVVARAQQDRRAEGQALGSLGRVALRLGETGQAIAHFEASLAVARATGNRRDQAIALGGLGSACRRKGDLDCARQYLEEDLAIARELGDRRGEARAGFLLSQVYEDQGDLEKAKALRQLFDNYEQELPPPMTSEA